MGAVSTIAIYDGATTPVERSFVPTRESSEGFIYLDKSSGAVVTYNKLVIATKLPSTSSTGEKNFRVKLQVHTPVGEVLPANPSLTRLAYTLRFSGEYVLPERSSEQERKHIAALVANAFNHTAIKGLVTSLDGQY